MIEFKNVVKNYNKTKALDKVSFNIMERRITCILGVNGSGKTTALKSIMGLTPVDSGEILIDGAKLSYKDYNKLSFIADVPGVYGYMTIAEMLRFMEIFYDNWDMNKARRMVDYFKLQLKQRIEELSKGNRARLKLILAYSRKSKYILMDEPFSGIDFLTRETFIETISEEFADEGQGLIITTHGIEEIESLADDIIILHHGRVLKEFSAEDAREQEGLSIMEVMREVYKNE